MSAANGDNLHCLVGVHIKEAWIENDTPVTRKLCVRYSIDTGAETFGCFRTTDEVCASDFEGLTVGDACKKFNTIVYPNDKAHFSEVSEAKTCPQRRHVL